MSQVFDVYTLIFLVIAVLIFLRLRNVLGRRTGNERPPFDQRTQAPGAKKPSGDDKVIAMPRRNGAAAPIPVESQFDEDEFIWEGYAKEGSSLAKSLDDMLEADPSFNPKIFTEGARSAYEMIVTAFAEGDRKTLRPLLSPDVYDGFAAAVSEREERGEIIESRFVGIESADFTAAEIKNGSAQMTVRFKSALVTVTRDSSGEVIDGDPKAVSDVTDIWTFARPVASRDPNWQLVATEAE